MNNKNLVSTLPINQANQKQQIKICFVIQEHFRRNIKLVVRLQAWARGAITRDRLRA